ncbi:MAG: hypothetical protein N4A49_04375 [Marinifilaceae bacterium]|jgi:hypothetical protein|nr:hypothetical protein [Marinifilaceae bacterium]
MTKGYNSGSQIIFENENLYSTNISINQDIEFTVSYGREDDVVSEAVNNYSLALSVKTNSIFTEKSGLHNAGERQELSEARQPVKFVDEAEIFDPVEDCACLLVDDLHKKQSVDLPISDSLVVREIEPSKKSYGFFQKKLAALFD